jgi:hypothetical protein
LGVDKPPIVWYNNDSEREVIKMKKDNTQAYEELNKLKIEVAKMLDPNYNYDYYNKKRGNKK